MRKNENVSQGKDITSTEAATADTLGAGTPGTPDAPGMPGASGMRPRDDENRLGTDRIGKLLFEFSLPAIISMVFNSLYSVVDTAILGWCVGDVGVAVSTLATPVMMILLGFSMLAGQGGNALAAIRLGEGKIESAQRTMGNATVLLIVIVVLIGVLANVFMEPLLAIIGTSEELHDPTQTFVRIVCTLFVFQSLGAGLNNFLRTAGKPVLALITMVFGTVMCVLFNLLFVALLGWGVAGSAWATVAGQACGMVPVVAYFLFSKKTVFQLRLRFCVPNLRLMGRICTLGIASFIIQVAATITGVVFNQVVAMYGANDPLGVTDALAAIGVAQRAAMFAIMPLIGLTMGAQPIIGYNFGARSWDRVLKTLKWAAICGILFGIFFFALAHLIPRQIVGLFGVTGDLADFAETSLRIYATFYPLVGFQIIGSSYFQSSGQPLKAAILELTRQIIFLIPLYFIMPQVSWLFGVSQLMMVVVAVPTSDALAICVTAIFVAFEVRKLRRFRAADAGGQIEAGVAGDADENDGSDAGAGRGGEDAAGHAGGGVVAGRGADDVAAERVGGGVVAGHGADDVFVECVCGDVVEDEAAYERHHRAEPLAEDGHDRLF